MQTRLCPAGGTISAADAPNVMSEVVSLINPQAEAAAAATLHPRRQTDDSSVGSDEHRRSSETANAISEGVIPAPCRRAAESPQLPGCSYVQAPAAGPCMSHACLRGLHLLLLLRVSLMRHVPAWLIVQGILPGLAAWMQAKRLSAAVPASSDKDTPQAAQRTPSGQKHQDDVHGRSMSLASSLGRPSSGGEFHRVDLDYSF